MRKPDLTGQRFATLTVIRDTGKRDKNGGVLWLCRCDCGNIKEMTTNALRKPTLKSCGCKQQKRDDLTGRVFGRLTVVEYIGWNDKQHTSFYKCRCECGNLKNISREQLLSGKTRSCGCLRSEVTSKRCRTHGEGNESRLFRIWSGIKSRCYNQNDANYKRYGGRGIVMCDEWLNSYVAFRDWALSRGYADDLSIDRIDNNGIYEPDNCRWATKKRQNNNRRTNALFTCEGETHTAAEWAEITGISEGTLISRRRMGWTDEECIQRPLRGHK